ncbi:transcription factor GTE4-like isoform X1 [Phragmites australis]|uniref:transcription factor GTE4-like isoform X1 n=1 Tax=Phragmites australis TaxID=29695 RepID=UPI002D76ECD3|nr:transcription factor GTE4-like isoform X1 [Phragmites australis]
MASAPPGDDGTGGEELAAGPASASPSAAPASASPSAAPASARSRWASEIKVYSRKYSSKNPKPSPDSSPNPNPLSETLSLIRRPVRRPEPGVAAAEAQPDPAAPSSSPPRPPPPPSPPDTAVPTSPPPPASNTAVPTSPPPPPPDPVVPTSPSPLPPAPASPGEPTPASGDISRLNRDGATVPNGHGNDRAVVAAEKAEKARKRRTSELRRQLALELDKVRVLSKRLKAAAEALAQEASTPMPLALLVPPSEVLDAGYMRSQFSPTGPVTPVPAQATAVAPVRSLLQRGPLTVSVVHTERFDKEKRTPKANQFYQNSKFLLAKDKFPSADSHGPKKSKHHKKKHRSLEAHGVGYDAERRLYSHALKKSSSLLSQLMKHKFGWVFNKPVNPVALGLHDYFAIIKHPMDLGTIRGRLSRGHYRNPKEFAEDVRLTFHNAMTYNPRGQDVHIMAEQLSGIFEAQWPEIEAEVNYLASCPPLPEKFPPPPIDLRFLERSDSVRHHMALDSNSRPISHTPTYTRTPSMKKPRAKDPNKRDMTIEEKRKLSDNLQNLPPERLDAVVQIIKNKNLSVRQHDDEIEVEIDSMDAETLWELDRFVANYKKNLSKRKRKAERAMLARQDAELRAQYAAQQPQPQPTQVTQEPNVGEKSPKQSVKDLMVSEQLATSAPDQNDNNRQNTSSSSNSSSSSSDSGSSSSDSDSDSSSSDGSDAANSS